MKTAWHLGAWNRNFGDWVLFESVQRHLVDAHGGPIQFVPVDSQRTRWSTELVEKLNDEASLLLVGGGGLIFNRPEDGSRSGWQFDITLEDLARIRVPLVVQSIGYNRFPHDPVPMPAVLDAHLRAVQAASTLFSVRNTGTRKELVRRGLDPARILVVPDAGIFAPMRPLHLQGAFDGSVPILGVNVAGDRPAHRYPAPGEANERLCLDVLGEALSLVADRTGARILLLPHVEQLDEQHDELLKQRIGAERVASLRELAPQVYPPGPVTASHLVGAYDLCDAVVGMRGHACLLAFGRGKPFLAFGGHAKNAFLLDDAGVGTGPVLPEALLSGTLTAEQLAESIAGMLAGQFPLTRALAARDRQQREFLAWNSRAADVLAAARRAA